MSEKESNEKVKQKLAMLMTYVDGAIDSSPTSHAVGCLINIHFEITNILNLLVYGVELKKPSKEVKK
jgi:hypothetical protein